MAITRAANTGDVVNDALLQVPVRKNELVSVRVHWAAKGRRKVGVRRDNAVACSEFFHVWCVGSARGLAGGVGQMQGHTRKIIHKIKKPELGEQIRIQSILLDLIG